MSLKPISSITTKILYSLGEESPTKQVCAQINDKIKFYFVWEHFDCLQFTFDCDHLNNLPYSVKFTFLTDPRSHLTHYTETLTLCNGQPWEKTLTVWIELVWTPSEQTDFPWQGLWLVSNLNIGLWSADGPCHLHVAMSGLTWPQGYPNYTQPGPSLPIKISRTFPATIFNPLLYSFTLQSSSLGSHQGTLCFGSLGKFGDLHWTEILLSSGNCLRYWYKLPSTVNQTNQLLVSESLKIVSGVLISFVTPGPPLVQNRIWERSETLMQQKQTREHNGRQIQWNKWKS